MGYLATTQSVTNHGIIYRYTEGHSKSCQPDSNVWLLLTVFIVVAASSLFITSTAFGYAAAVDLKNVRENVSDGYCVVCLEDKALESI